MVRKSVSCALVALLALSACSHGGSRHFGGAKPGENPPTNAPSENPPPDSPPPTTPPANDPPPGDPPSTPNNDGSLARTSDLTTGIVGRTLHVGGNVVLGLGGRTNLPLGHVGAQIDGAGHALQDNGLAGLPLIGGALANKVEGLDGHLNGLAQVQLINQPVLGATTPGGNQAIGVSALSQTPSTGQVATIGLLNQGSSQQPLNVSLGGTQILGQPGPAAVNVGVLNGGSQIPSPLGAITAPLTGGGQTPVGGVLGAVTAPVTNGGAQTPVGGVLNGVTGLLGRN